MFRVHTLGMGNFFTEKYNHPSFLLEMGKVFLMLEAPAGIPKILRSYQKTLWCRSQPYPGNVERIDIRKVLRFAVTHSHVDHAGGVETLAFWKFYKEWRQSKRLCKGGKPLPKLFVTPEVKSDLEKQLMLKLDASDLYPGKVLKFSDYFDVRKGDIGETHDEGQFMITPTYAEHAVSACGFLIEYMGKSLWYSGDTSFHPEIVSKYAHADKIIYDGSDIKAGGHPTIRQILTLPDSTLEKMVLYHVPDDKIEKRDGNCKDLRVVGTDLRVLKQYEFFDME